MKKFSNHINQYRIRTGLYFSDDKYGMTGAWEIPDGNDTLYVISSNGMGWEHASVSLKDRCPTWGEMCHIKNLFWNDDEVVMQLHPAKKDYVNQHENCLHLCDRYTKTSLCRRQY